MKMERAGAESRGKSQQQAVYASILRCLFFVRISRDACEPKNCTTAARNCGTRSVLVRPGRRVSSPGVRGCRARKNRERDLLESIHINEITGIMVEAKKVALRGAECCGGVSRKAAI